MPDADWESAVLSYLRSAGYGPWHRVEIVAYLGRYGSAWCVPDALLADHHREAVERLLPETPGWSWPVWEVVRAELEHEHAR